MKDNQIEICQKYLLVKFYEWQNDLIKKRRCAAAKHKIILSWPNIYIYIIYI